MKNPNEREQTADQVEAAAASLVNQDDAAAASTLSEANRLRKPFLDSENLLSDQDRADLDAMEAEVSDDIPLVKDGEPCPDRPHRHENGVVSKGVGLLDRVLREVFGKPDTLSQYTSLEVENFPMDSEDSRTQEVTFAGSEASEGVVSILITINTVDGAAKIVVGNGPDHEMLPYALSSVMGDFEKLLTREDFIKSWLDLNEDEAADDTTED